MTGERPVNQRAALVQTLAYAYQWRPKATPDVPPAPDGKPKGRSWTGSRNAGQAPGALSRRRRRNAIAAASRRRNRR